MAKLIRSVAAVLAVVVIAMASCGHGLPDDQSPAAAKKWVKQFPRAKPQFTELHFYLQHIVSKNPPASEVLARANSTATSPTRFGLSHVLDAPLTEKPDPNSKVIGYSQGIFTFSSREEQSSLMTLTFTFTDGKYKGSTLSILGRNAVTTKYREFPIIGGSGDFRMAQGIGTASTYYLNATTGDDILEINVAVYRYILPGRSY